MAGENLTDRISAKEGEDLFEQYKQTHETIDRPEKFADMFCGVAESQSIVRKKLVEILTTSIKHDVETRKEIKSVLFEIYHDDWKSFVRTSFGKIAIVIWTVFTIGIGAFINSLF